MQLVLECLAAHRFFTGKHLVGIAGDGIDLAVMDDQTVRMRLLPARSGVGGEAGVNHRNGGNKAGSLEIQIETAQLAHKEHALVNDRAARQGADVGQAVGLLEFAAYKVQLAVKVKTLGAFLRACHEALPDLGHALSGTGAEDLRGARYSAPAEELQAVALGDDLKELLGLRTFQLTLGEEEHADAEVTLLAELDAFCLGDILEVGVGDLRQNADAVTCLAFCILAGAVLQLFYDRKRILDDTSGTEALEVDDCTDTAVVVLKCGAVKPLCLVGRFISEIVHNFHPFKN